MRDIDADIGVSNNVQQVPPGVKAKVEVEPRKELEALYAPVMKLCPTATCATSHPGRYG